VAIDPAVQLRAYSLLDKGETVTAVAAALGVSRKSVHLWTRRRKERSAASSGGSSPRWGPAAVDGLPTVPNPQPRGQDTEAEAGCGASERPPTVEEALAWVLGRVGRMMQDPSAAEPAINRCAKTLLDVEKRQRVLALEARGADVRYDFERLTTEEVRLVVPLLERARVP
jgi:transposase-like protein